MKFPQHAPRFLSLWFFSVFCVMLLLALGRLALWIFAAEAGFPPEETARAWSVALRFDMMAAAYLCTPVLLCWGATAAFPPHISREKYKPRESGTPLAAPFKNMQHAAYARYSGTLFMFIFMGIPIF